MTMTTPADLIARALRKAGVTGVGQAAAAEDITDALSELNSMLAQWQRRRWLVYHLAELVKLSTGATTYTVGPGGDLDTATAARPDQIEAAYCRQITGNPEQVDFPLNQVAAREDFARIPVKMLPSIPALFWYDAAYPLGTLYPWPQPPAGTWEFHVLVKAPLQTFATAFDTINLPPEYEDALLYNLAARLRPSYQLPPDPQVTALALAALETIRTANAQVPQMQMPPTIMGQGRYNIFGDFGR